MRFFLKFIKHKPSKTILLIVIQLPAQLFYTGCHPVGISVGNRQLSLQRATNFSVRLVVTSVNSLLSCPLTLRTYYRHNIKFLTLCLLSLSLYSLLSTNCSLCISLFLCHRLLIGRSVGRQVGGWVGKRKMQYDRVLMHTFSLPFSPIILTTKVHGP